jgi:hypothetical protein
MKYALIFAGIAAATENYGYGYYAKPAVPTTTSTSSKIGYTTIYPGYGKEPVTVTKQYQPIPTYSASSWSEYPFVSTTIKDYDGKTCTISKYDEEVTVYHTKKTLTHYKTEPVYAPAPTGGYYGYPLKNATTTKAYYELYEKVHEVKYNELGPKVLPGYPGSGLWNDKKHQPVKVKEYQNGKWSEYTQVFTYDAPKPSATTFEKPGIYTIPSYDVTVEYPTTVPAEATYTAPAGKPVTYGGVTATVTKATTITVGYGAYETHGAETKTVIKTKTVTCPSAGHYEVVKPTTSIYKTKTEIKYPVASTYPAGEYHHPAETVTVTKSHQPYTCSYSQTKTYPVPSAYPTVSKPSKPTKTPAYPTETPAYPTETPSATESEYPSETEYPTADPSADYPEPTESYGTPYAGYVKRGGMLERRAADAAPKKAQAGKRVILV